MPVTQPFVQITPIVMISNLSQVSLDEWHGVDASTTVPYGTAKAVQVIGYLQSGGDNYAISFRKQGQTYTYTDGQDYGGVDGAGRGYFSGLVEIDAGAAFDFLIHRVSGSSPLAGGKLYINAYLK